MAQCQSVLTGTISPEERASLRTLDFDLFKYATLPNGGEQSLRMLSFVVEMLRDLGVFKEYKIDMMVCILLHADTGAGVAEGLGWRPEYGEG